MERENKSRRESGEPGALLEVRGLTKHYSDFTLDRVSFSLPGGCIMGLMGENGAGKSTAIKAILGLIHLDGGQVRIFGQEVSERNRELKERVGLVMEGLNLPDSMNGREAGKLMSGLYRHWDGPLFERYLRDFSINPGKKLKDYSRGMRMKLSLAIALSHGASLLVLDEPTSGLDPMIREEVLDLLREFVMEETHSVLISSHIIGDLEKAADYVAFLHRGRLVLCEEKDRLLEEYRILKGSREDILELEREGKIRVAGLRENSFGAEALICPAKDRREGTGDPWRRLLSASPQSSGRQSDMALEPANLEEIFLYFGGNSPEEKGSGKGEER